MEYYDVASSIQGKKHHDETPSTIPIGPKKNNVRFQFPRKQNLSATRTNECDTFGEPTAINDMVPSFLPDKVSAAMLHHRCEKKIENNIKNQKKMRSWNPATFKMVQLPHEMSKTPPARRTIRVLPQKAKKNRRNPTTRHDLEQYATPIYSYTPYKTSAV